MTVQKERLTENAIGGDTEIERMAKSLKFNIVYVTVWNYNLLHHFFTVKELRFLFTHAIIFFVDYILFWHTERSEFYIKYFSLLILHIS